MKRSVENWYYNLKLNENWRSYATLKLSYLKIMEVAISTRLEPAVVWYQHLDQLTNYIHPREGPLHLLRPDVELARVDKPDDVGDLCDPKVR